MRITSRQDKRFLRIETLEHRELLSAVPSTAIGASVLQSATVTASGDTVIPINVQVGGTALETVLGVAAKIDSLETIVDAYLNEVPGWHLIGGVDTTPTYSGTITGSVTISPIGTLKSANITLTGSADIGADIEGYYGISVLHVGVGAAADVSANISATASYSVSTNAWYFGGSASLSGYAKGYASATAWPLKGEIYIQGNLSANAAVSSSTGIASTNIAVVGSVGADAQIQSLFGGWSTIASVSKTIGSWQYGATFNVGTWLESEVSGVTAADQAVKASAISANFAAQTKASAVSATTVSSPVATNVTTTVTSQPTATVAPTTTVSTSVASGVSSLVTAASTTQSAATASLLASVQASALQQLSATPLLPSGYLVA
jgi:hypothetical protein